MPRCRVGSSRKFPDRRLRAHMWARGRVYARKWGLVGLGVATWGRSGVAFRLPSQPSGAFNVRAKVTAFSRIRRHEWPHGGVSKRFVRWKVSTAVRPVPQNPAGHPHFPSPPMIAAEKVPEYGNARPHPPEHVGQEQSKAGQLAEVGQKRVRNVPEGLQSWRTAFKIFSCLGAAQAVQAPNGEFVVIGE